MTKEERSKLNGLHNRVVNNCGVFIMSDEWYDKTDYTKACFEFNGILNRLREIEKYLYTPYNLGYYGVLGSKDSDFDDFIRKIRATNNLMGLDRYVSIEEELCVKKKNEIEYIKRKLPLTEEEFDNIQEGTYAWYLSDLDAEYKFTKLEKLYLMEYILLKCELKRGK